MSAADIAWSCELTCRACDTTLYHQVGALEGVVLDGTRHRTVRTRQIARAFAAYQRHRLATGHREGGHLRYHENAD